MVMVMSFRAPLYKHHQVLPGKIGIGELYRHASVVDWIRTWTDYGVQYRELPLPTSTVSAFPPSQIFPESSGSSL